MTMGATIYLMMLLGFGVMAPYELRSAMDGDVAEKRAKDYGERRAHPAGVKLSVRFVASD